MNTIYILVQFYLYLLWFSRNKSYKKRLREESNPVKIFMNPKQKVSNVITLGTTFYDPRQVTCKSLQYVSGVEHPENGHALFSGRRKFESRITRLRKVVEGFPKYSKCVEIYAKPCFNTSLGF